MSKFRASLSHEVLVLFLYGVLTLFLEVFMFFGPTSGDEGIAHVYVIFSIPIVWVFSTIFISLSKRDGGNNIEFYYWLVPLLLFEIVIVLLLGELCLFGFFHEDEKNNYLMRMKLAFSSSSFWAIIIVYGYSIRYKYKKQP